MKQYVVYGTLGPIALVGNIEEAEQRKPGGGYVERVDKTRARRIRRVLDRINEQARSGADEESPLERIAD